MKQSLRMLALGFLISAVLLLVFDTFFSSSAQAEKSADQKTTAETKDNSGYKKKYEDLLASQELAKSQAAEAQKAVAAKKKAEEEKAKQAANQVKKFTLVIKKGDPSSKAGNELQFAGIIKSGAEFDKFLRSNNYEKYVRDGSYAVDSNMTADQIAKIITHKN
ncbi:hypothetical protein [Listeria rustica]|uniref:Endolytic transglycosylase MltG n=1 Tax=Listeria rustica TaxID=2713503 RepID=A0A7W1T4P0_9LIST|nr:hypothetical protein [Listeria rustica]MBA3925389.1 hypothetical protein [Listeria rustica]